MREWCIHERNQSKQHQPFVHLGPPAIPHSARHEQSEQEEDEEKRECNAGVPGCPAGHKIPAKVKPAPRLLDGDERSDHYQRNRQQHTGDPESPVNGGASRGDERCLRQKYEEPCR